MWESNMHHPHNHVYTHSESIKTITEFKKLIKYMPIHIITNNDK